MLTTRESNKLHKKRHSSLDAANKAPVKRSKSPQKAGNQEPKPIKFLGGEKAVTFGRAVSKQYQVKVF